MAETDSRVGFGDLAQFDSVRLDIMGGSFEVFDDEDERRGKAGLITRTAIVERERGLAGIKSHPRLGREIDVWAGEGDRQTKPVLIKLNRPSHV